MVAVCCSAAAPVCCSAAALVFVTTVSSAAATDGTPLQECIDLKLELTGSVQNDLLAAAQVCHLQVAVAAPVSLGGSAGGQADEDEAASDSVTCRNASC
jgi:hypothetical protein